MTELSLAGRVTAPLPRDALSSRVCEWLRCELTSGRWQEKLPGERKLCEQLGVSRPTLRAALLTLQEEGRVEIGHGRATRIVGAGVVPGRMADRVSRVRLLSPIPLHEMPPFMVCWLDLLREKLGGVGRALELEVSRAAFAARPEKALQALVGAAGPSVWILYRSGALMQRWFESNGVRCVVAGSVVEGVGLPSIDLDYRAVCRHAAGLLRARGRRSAVLVLPENKAVGDVESWAGFTDGYGAESRLVLHDGTADEVRRAVRIAMKLKPQPDAFVVARSAHALTVLTYLMSEGIRVPEQVVVISRDDDSFLAHTVPEVARYSTDPRVWAQRLFVQVEKLAAGERSRSGTLRLVPKLVVGGSLG